MTVEVLCFALVRALAGSSSIRVELPEPATVGHLRDRLGEQFPSLAPLLPSLLVAVHNHYAANDFVIPKDAEVALIPPVSGGAAPS